MIPYMLAPMAAMSVQYPGTAIDLFPLCSNMVLWTRPVLLSGFLATISIMGVAARLCGLAVSFLSQLFSSACGTRNAVRRRSLPLPINVACECGLLRHHLGPVHSFRSVRYERRLIWDGSILIDMSKLQTK